MPYKIRKLPNQNRYRITNAHNGKVVAKSTTKEKLSKLGSMHDDYDSIINELIEHSDMCDSFWSDRN